MMQVKALIDVIMEVDTSLEQEVSRNWSEIMKHFYVFDRRHKEVSPDYTRSQRACMHTQHNKHNAWPHGTI